MIVYTLELCPEEGPVTRRQFSDYRLASMYWDRQRGINGVLFAGERPDTECYRTAVEYLGFVGSYEWDWLDLPSAIRDAYQVILEDQVFFSTTVM